MRSLHSFQRADGFSVVCVYEYFKFRRMRQVLDSATSHASDPVFKAKPSVSKVSVFQLLTAWPNEPTEIIHHFLPQVVLLLKFHGHLKVKWNATRKRPILWSRRHEKQTQPTSGQETNVCLALKFSSVFKTKLQPDPFFVEPLCAECLLKWRKSHVSKDYDFIFWALITVTRPPSQWGFSLQRLCMPQPSYFV